MKYYDKHEPTCVVSVLGTNYAVYMGVMPDDDPMLKSCDGYHDKTAKRIVVIGKVEECDLDD